MREGFISYMRKEGVEMKKTILLLLALPLLLTPKVS